MSLRNSSFCFWKHKLSCDVKFSTLDYLSSLLHRFQISISYFPVASLIILVKNWICSVPLGSIYATKSSQSMEMGFGCMSMLCCSGSIGLSASPDRAQPLSFLGSAQFAILSKHQSATSWMGIKEVRGRVLTLYRSLHHSNKCLLLTT